MGFLSDIGIAEAMGRGVSIDPWPQILQPASVDIHLSPVLRIITESEEQILSLEAHQGWLLTPGQFILGLAIERIALSQEYQAEIVGKSRLARLGLVFLHGHLDPGWADRPTLELGCLSPRGIRLYPGMPIGQIRIAKLEQSSRYPYGHPEYGSHYKAAKLATAPVPSHIRSTHQPGAQGDWGEYPMTKTDQSLYASYQMKPVLRDLLRPPVASDQQDPPRD